MRFRAVLAGLLAVGGATSLHAETSWVQVSADTKGAEWFVDVNSIKDVSEGYPVAKVRKAWIKIDHSKDKTQIARETKALFFFKCVEEQAKSTTWVMYKADGTVLRDVSAPLASYSPVISDTVQAGAMEMICSLKLPKIP